LSHSSAGAPPGLAWTGVAALLALAALAGWLLPREAIDWQPARAWPEPGARSARSACTTA